MTQQPYAQSQTAPSVDDVLMGGGGPTPARFDVGAEVGGRVISVQQREERVFDRDNPGRGPIKTYPSGDTIWGLVVTVATAQRDDADDDGQRRIFVEGQRMKGAVREAILTAGARSLEIGGELYVTKTGKESAGVGIEANTWHARFVPAAQAALMTPQPPQPEQPAPQPEQPAPQPEQPAPQQQPAQQQPAQPVQQPAQQQPAQQQPATSTTYTPEQIAVMQQAGIPIPGA